MFCAGGSGAISLASIRTLFKNLIYQLAEISNNMLIFSYLRRGGAPSGASSTRRRRLNLSRPQLTGLTTATGFATKYYNSLTGFYTLFLCKNKV